MKTNLFMLALAAAGSLLTGCNDDDDNIQVDQAIESAFQNQYPGATRVEWEVKSGYYVADFWLNNTEAEAWYSDQAIWYMTETDIPYSGLPQAVKTVFEASDYATWKKDDVDMLECLDMETVYIIEVEQGETEYDLYYSPEGVFIKAVANGNASVHQPSEVLPTVKAFIAEKYPQARIADIETEYNSIEVDIIDGSTARELRFDLSGEWVYTKTEVRKANVPATVLATLNASEYGSWQIDDIDHYLTAASEYYLFELESGNREVNLKIDINGNIL